jgi:hypothetical protein
MSYRAPSLVLLVGCLTAVAMDAQSTPPPPQTVEAAEAEGAKHPKATEGTDFTYGDAVGPKERKCVDADKEKHVVARSGEFVAGPFGTPVMFGTPGNYRRKVWWAPRQTAVMPPMQFRAVKVGAPDVTVSWTFPSVVHNENGFFFNTLFRFPAVGKWLVVVTSGNSWGCFILDEI